MKRRYDVFSWLPKVFHLPGSGYSGATIFPFQLLLADVKNFPLLHTEVVKFCINFTWTDQISHLPCKRAKALNFTSSLSTDCRFNNLQSTRLGSQRNYRREIFRWARRLSPALYAMLHCFCHHRESLKWSKYGIVQAINTSLKARANGAISFSFMEGKMLIECT